jgi:hypothetical protein
MQLRIDVNWVSSCSHGKELSGFIKFREFLDWLKK